MFEKKSVCIMTSVHPHDDVRVYHKGAKTLRQAGFDVTLLNAFYEGVDEFGIKFVKVDVPKTRFRRIMTAPRLFYKRAVLLDCDYYHFHDPELLLAGVKLAKSKRVIFDIHEDVPRQILTKPYLKPAVARVASAIYERREQRSVSKLFAVIAAEPVIFDRIKQFNKNTVMVCNYPLLSEFGECAKVERTRSVCYIGGITKIRGIFEMLEAVEDTDVTLYLAGSFEDDKLKSDVQTQNGYSNAQYMGFIGRSQVQNLLSTVSAGLVTLHPIPKYLTALPVKMFEYMIAEVPVISSNFPYWKDIVDDAQCGICVDPQKPQEIKAAIKYILDNPEIARAMGENGRKMVLQKYNWEIERVKLLSIYADCDQNDGDGASL